MLIDWFTVIAQAVNFLILVWLLKRFLYTPILNAIHEREEKIKSKLEHAENELAEAKEEKAEFHRKNEKFEQRRESMLSEATEEADTLRRRRLEEARKEAEALRKQLEASFREEQENLSREIVERTQREVFAIAQKVLSDLASAKLEEHITDVFLRQLREMEKAEKESLEAALIRSPRDTVVRSAFEIPAGQRRKVETALTQIAGTNIELSFEKTPRLIGGVTLTAGGYKVSWSIKDYLRSLESMIGELIDQEQEQSSEPITKTAPNESSAR